MSIFIPASPPYTGMSETPTPAPNFDDSNIDPALGKSSKTAYQDPTEAAAALNQARSRREQQQGLYTESSEGVENRSSVFDQASPLENEFWNDDMFRDFRADEYDQFLSTSAEPQQTPGGYVHQPGGYSMPGPGITSAAPVNHQSQQQAQTQPVAYPQQTFPHQARGPSSHGSQIAVQQQHDRTSGPSGFNSDGQQQSHHNFRHVQSQSRCIQPDPIVPRSEGPTNAADRTSAAPHPDPDLAFQPHYHAQNQDDGSLWPDFPTPTMDLDDPDFDWDAFMAGNVFNQEAEQQHQPSGGPYFVEGAGQAQEVVAGPSNINPQMLRSDFQEPAERLRSLTPTSPFHYSPRPTSGRPKHKDRASVSVTDNPECIDCGKRYRRTGSPGRCNRCGAKYERKIAEPFTYTLASNVPNLVAAKRLIYPPIEGRLIHEDDFHQFQPVQRENFFLQQLLNAVNVIQTEDDGADEWKIRQQKTFNEKAKLEPGYTNDQVTARLRALFWEAVMFHNGGHESVYAVGGDNAGYAENLKFKFSERFGIICDVLRSNKRVVMDVIEGRGVQGFVVNPRKYDNRKASNNDCNVKKKKMMDKGKEVEGEDGNASAGPSRGAKRKRRQDSPDDVMPSVETVDAELTTTGLRRSPRGHRTFSPVEDDELSLFPSHDGEHQASEQTYGSGRAVTANWVHGRRGRG